MFRTENQLLRGANRCQEPQPTLEEWGCFSPDTAPLQEKLLLPPHLKPGSPLSPRTDFLLSSQESLTASLKTRAMSSPLASLSKTRKVPLESEPVNPG